MGFSQLHFFESGCRHQAFREVVKPGSEGEMTAAKLFYTELHAPRIASQIPLVNPLLRWLIGDWMPAPSNLTRLANRTSSQARSPIPELKLEPYPPEVTKRFPAMAEHHKRNNERLAAWLKSVNVNQSS